MAREAGRGRAIRSCPCGRPDRPGAGRGQGQHACRQATDQALPRPALIAREYVDGSVEHRTTGPCLVRTEPTPVSGPPTCCIRARLSPNTLGAERLHAAPVPTRRIGFNPGESLGRATDPVRPLATAASPMRPEGKPEAPSSAPRRPGRTRASGPGARYP